MQTLVTLFAESTAKHGVLEGPWLEENVYVQMKPQDEGVSGVWEAIAGGWMSVVSPYVPVITSITVKPVKRWNLNLEDIGVMSTYQAYLLQ